MWKALAISLTLAAMPLAAQITNRSVLGTDEYFRFAATNFVFAENEAASNWVHQGLLKFRNDKRLQALAGLVPTNQPPPQPQNQPKPDQQNQQDQQKQQQQNKSGQKGDDKEQQQNQESQKDKQDQQQASQASGQQKKDSEEKEQKDAAAYAAGQMTQEQAEQLLDAQKEEEQVLPVKPEGKPMDRARKIKDW
ncbi:MAG: hypothetical protein C5B50_20135 [Verrucomicrobia bacterium]|nr:MAG: hypothetical protein C5B50_20135 [Verrucomicrobiota bacterium]